MNETAQRVREYYGNRAMGDVIACDVKPSPEVAEALALLPVDIVDGFRGGIGYPFPPALEGCTVLVLGAANGRDAFIASKLVGEAGRVIAIEPCGCCTKKAHERKDEVARAFGYAKSNVHFMDGCFEDLAAYGIADESIDVVIANCTLSYSPFKLRALQEVYRVLKQGGELFSFDVYASRRLDPEQASNPALAGGILATTLYVEDYRRVMRRAGWEDFRHMNEDAVSIVCPEAAAAVGDTTYEGRYVRAIKSPVIEDICEQYGQYATYTGGIVGCDEYFDLDDHHRFFLNEPMSVCSNSCSMVQDSRYGKWFKIEGDLSHHYGAFGKCGNVERKAE